MPPQGIGATAMQETGRIPSTKTTHLVRLIPFVVIVVVWAIRIRSGSVYLCSDDLVRIVLSKQFAQSSFFAPADAYWLPAPFWILGSFLRFGYGTSPWMQLFPSLSASVISIFLLQKIERDDFRNDSSPIIGYLFLSLPLSYLLLTSTLSTEGGFNNSHFRL